MEFDLAAFDAADEVTLDIRHPVTGEPIGWQWKIAGPGHPKTIEIGNRAAREQMREAAEKEQQRVNGKKWKATEQAIEEVRERNIAAIAARVLSWGDIKIAGQLLTYSQEETKRLLLDPKKAWLLQQVLDFLSEQENFMQRSAKA